MIAVPHGGDIPDASVTSGQKISLAADLSPPSPSGGGKDRSGQDVVVEPAGLSARTTQASKPSTAAATAAKPPLPPKREQPPQPQRTSRRTAGASRASPAAETSSGSVIIAATTQPGLSKAPTATDDAIAAAAADKEPDLAMEADAAAGADGGAGSALSDLERERATIMERNRRLLLELKLPGLVAGVAAAAAAEGLGSGGGSGGGGGGGKRQASQRGVGSKRSRDSSSEPPPPRRASLRQRGVAADAALVAGIEQETRAGVQLAAGRQAVEAATGRPAGQPSPEKSRHPRGDLPFRSDNGDPDSDAAFLGDLKIAAAAAPAGAAGGAGKHRGSEQQSPRKKTALSAEALSRLGLLERDVAKVTKDGVTHLAWLPGSQRLLLAAADKSGRVSLWDVDVREDGPAADTDGVLMFSPHGEYVSGLRWLASEAAVGPSRLITASYDGSLRALDLGGAGTWLQLPAPGDPAETEFSALEVAPDGRTAFLGDPLGNLDVVDLRAPPPPPRQQQQRLSAGAAAEGLREEREGVPRSSEGAGTAAVAVGPLGGVQLCDRKINSLHLAPGCDHLLASSCSDGTVCVWDVRTLSTAAAAASAGGASREGGKVKALSVLRHGKSCHAAFWAGDGSRRLLSTSYDDTIRIWADPAAGTAADGSRLAQLLSIPHNNQTGRWITPFRAVWNAACDGVLVGNMRRGLDVYSVPGAQASAGAAAVTAAGSGKLLRTLTADAMTAIPSRAACHPSLPVLVAATSSGRCHIWR